MKTIAFYLPQFHQIPENDQWWGKGFTEWVNVKKAQALFEEHYQPRIPLYKNYYDLTNHNVLLWQAQIAKKYGVYGFCIYHYWFDGHMLLEKPMEILYAHPEIDTKYCICWANEDWTNAWVSKDNRTLISQTYGKQEDWKLHFEYLKKFFFDKRYICDDGKPILVIYRPEIIPCLNEMLDFWNEEAKACGLKGMTYIYQHAHFALQSEKDDSRFTYNIEYEPQTSRLMMNNQRHKFLRKIKNSIDLMMQKYFHQALDLSMYRKNDCPEKFSYDEIWRFILSREPQSSKSIPGAFVDWDNTPRRGARGSVAIGSTPEKFYMYFKRLVQKTKEVYNKDFIFVFAWNEWAEGGYLEPDEKNKYGYLESIHKALTELNELPEEN